MGLLALSACGIVLGLLAWTRFRRAGRLGLGTMLGLGVAGAFMGAFLSCAATNSAVTELHLTGVLGGVMGSIALLAIAVRALPRRRREIAHAAAQRAIVEQS